MSILMPPQTKQSVLQYVRSFLSCYFVNLYSHRENGQIVATQIAFLHYANPLKLQKHIFGGPIRLRYFSRVRFH